MKLIRAFGMLACGLVALAMLSGCLGAGADALDKADQKVADTLPEACATARGAYAAYALFDAISGVSIPASISATAEAAYARADGLCRTPNADSADVLYAVMAAGRDIGRALKQAKGEAGGA